MFWGRTVLTVFLLFVSGGLCAFDLEYGSWFRVEDISMQEGRPVLPLERGQYANLRVLDEETFSFLKTCSADCLQENVSADPELFEIRAALTRPGMWIADVSFDGKWLVTFLVFQNKDGYVVKEPDNFVFLDSRLKQKVERMLALEAARIGRDVILKETVK